MFRDLKKAGLKCEKQRDCTYEGHAYQSPCLNNGTCEEGVNLKLPDVPYTCTCSIGFDGPFCEEVHPCHPMKV